MTQTGIVNSLTSTECSDYPKGFKSKFTRGDLGRLPGIISTSGYIIPSSCYAVSVFSLTDNYATTILLSNIEKPIPHQVTDFEDICNPKMSYIGIPTSTIDDVLSEIDKLSMLSNNWDDEGAIAISDGTARHSKDQIRKIQAFLFIKNQSFKSVFSFIGPVSDGSITIEFSHLNKELDIEFNDHNPGEVYFIKSFTLNQEESIEEGKLKISDIRLLLSWLLDD
ncbi:MAG: hypothetical protein H8E46_06030 [FCB group bacterium]|nr:hypothetical protein [FCB group bacterium]